MQTQQESRIHVARSAIFAWKLWHAAVAYVLRLQSMTCMMMRSGKGAPSCGSLVFPPRQCARSRLRKQHRNFASSRAGRPPWFHIQDCLHASETESPESPEFCQCPLGCRPQLTRALVPESRHHQARHHQVKTAASHWHQVKAQLNIPETHQQHQLQQWLRHCHKQDQVHAANDCRHKTRQGRSASLAQRPWAFSSTLKGEALRQQHRSHLSPLRPGNEDNHSPNPYQVMLRR